MFRKQQQLAMKKEQDEKEEEMVGKEIIVIDGKTSATIWLWPDYSYLYFTTIHSYWHEEENTFFIFFIIIIFELHISRRLPNHHCTSG